MTDDDAAGDYTPPVVQLTLPGLELGAENGGKSGVLRRAVEATITALHAENLLQPRHAALCQLALTLADAVAVGTRSGRASAAAMAAAQLRETLQALPEPSQAGVAERFESWIRELQAESDAEAPAP